MRTVMRHVVVTIHTFLYASSGKPAQPSSSFHSLTPNPSGHVVFFGLVFEFATPTTAPPPHNTPSDISVTYDTFIITDLVLYM